MKQLITAEVVRARHAAGEKCIAVTRLGHIVTPEARTVADELGVAIQMQEDGNVAKAACAKPAGNTPAAAADADIDKIRAEVLARLPDGAASPQLVDQLIEKMVAERKAAAAAPATSAATMLPYEFDRMPGGIKRIKGNSLRMGIFEGAGEENQVGIVDVVTSEDGSSIAAGFMSWENCFFPWTLTYDEVNIVLEGELHVRCDGQTLVAKAGDVFFIPENSSIEFGTPTHVRMMYVAYPANWSE